MDTFAAMNSTLRIDVSTDGDIATLAMSGELDEAACSMLGDCLDRHRRPGARVLLDMRGLNFVDTAGLELLSRLYVESSLEGWTFAVMTTGERYIARAAAA
jgi:anti-anti-sigma factor